MAPPNQLGFGTTSSLPNGSQIPGIPHTSTITPLDQSEYPNVKWWTKKQWTSRSDHDEASTVGDSDDNDQRKIKLTDCLENKQGTPLTEGERHEIYQHAQLIWALFANTRTPPAGYKMVDIAYLTRYRDEMEREFPILQLCARHWKADQIWILNYPSWLRNSEKKVERGKNKCRDVLKSEEAETDIPIGTASKRKHGDIATTRKRHKNTHQTSDPATSTSSQLSVSQPPAAESQPERPQPKVSKTLLNLPTSILITILSLSVQVQSIHCEFYIPVIYYLTRPLNQSSNCYPITTNSFR